MDSSLIATIVSSVVGVAIGVIGIWLALKSLKLAKLKEPVWAYLSAKIIGLVKGAPEELRLTFAGKPISELYQTAFIFFNRGHDEIRSQDIQKKPKVYFNDAKIVREPQIILRSRDEIDFSVKKVASKKGDCVELGFSFLEYNDGAVVEVLHTKSSKIECSGTILGTDKRGIESEDLFIPFLPESATIARDAAQIRRWILVNLFLILVTAVLLPFMSRGAIFYGLLSFILLSTAFIIWANLFITRKLKYLRRFPNWTSELFHWD